VVMALHLDDLTAVIAAPTGGAELEHLSVRGVGDLADWEGQGQRMAWAAALVTPCLGEGGSQNGKAPPPLKELRQIRAAGRPQRRRL